jgi:hypothetical protein
MLSNVPPVEKHDNRTLWNAHHRLLGDAGSCCSNDVHVILVSILFVSCTAFLSLTEFAFREWTSLRRFNT